MIGLKVLETLGLYRPLDYDHKRFDRLAKRLESPIEKIFWSAAYFELSKYGELTPQVEVNGFRADFVYLVKSGGRFAIELDGRDYHSSAAQREYDYRRQRVLQQAGLQVIRFTGSEIFGDVQKCVKDILGIVRTERL